MSAWQSAKLQEHVRQEHRISPLQTYLKEIVYGGNDGIVTTFAVVAGYAGASLGDGIAGYSFLTVLLFGIANLFSDGASMGLGNFLSLRAEQDVYRAEQRKELREIREHQEKEWEESVDILISKGFTEAQAQELVAIYATNEEYWLQFMMNNELELANPLEENAASTAFATFCAFLVFGFIPLIPFFFVNSIASAFFTSLTATILALVLLGILRWKIVKGSIVRSVAQIVFVGGVAAAIAYAVGTFFRA